MKIIFQRFPMLTRPIFSYFYENLHFMNFNLQNSIILIENWMKTLSFCFQKGIIQSLIWNLPFFPLPKYYKLQVCHFQISSNKNFCEIYNRQKNIQLWLNKGFDTRLFNNWSSNAVILSSKIADFGLITCTSCGTLKRLEQCGSSMIKMGNLSCWNGLVNVGNFCWESVKLVWLTLGTLAEIWKIGLVNIENLWKIVFKMLG